MVTNKCLTLILLPSPIFGRMPTIEIIIFLLVVLVVFSAIVERLKIPQSIMLVVAGLVIGFTPQLPDVDLKPDTVFLIFLPPLLFTAS